MADENKSLKEKFKWLLGRTLNDYYKNNEIKNKLNDIKFEDAYQDKLIKFFMSNVTNEYIDTPLTESDGVKLLYVKNGLILVKQVIPSVTKVEDSKLVATEKIKLISSNLLDSTDVNYQRGLVEISLDLPLYNLDGIYDEINEANIIRRIREFNLKGEEEFVYEGMNQKICRFSTTLNLDTPLLSSHILSDKFNTIDSSIETEEGISIIDNNKIYLNILVNKISNIYDDKFLSDINTDRVNQLKEYLTKKPIKLICIRETSLIESIRENPYSLTAYKGDTYIIIEEENNCIPQIMFRYNIEAEYREAIANSQAQTLLNDEDVNDNIVPYLMDMEMNLMSLDDSGGDDI